MIDINLLPDELRPKLRSMLPYVAIASAALVVLVWIAIDYISMASRLAGISNELVMIEADLQELAPALEQVRELEAKQALLSLRKKAIEEITQGRLLWSYHLYLLADLVPEDIWINAISLGVKRRPVPAPDTGDKKGATTAPVMRSIRTLKISGYALSPVQEEGVELVGRFIRALEQESPEFSKYFVNPELQSIRRRIYENVVVMEFDMDCEIASEAQL